MQHCEPFLVQLLMHMLDKSTELMHTRNSNIAENELNNFNFKSLKNWTYKDLVHKPVVRGPVTMHYPVTNIIIYD